MVKLLSETMSKCVVLGLCSILQHTETFDIHPKVGTVRGVSSIKWSDVTAWPYLMTETEKKKQTKIAFVDTHDELHLNPKRNIYLVNVCINQAK